MNKYCIFFHLLKNINTVKNIPVKRHTWELEMKVLELNIELSDLIKRYEKYKFEKSKKESLNNNSEPK